MIDQPFNDNMYRPCPMLKIRKSERNGRRDRSTFHRSSVTGECRASLRKCDRYAENWKPVAEEMWKEDQERKAAKKGC